MNIQNTKVANSKKRFYYAIIKFYPCYEIICIYFKHILHHFNTVSLLLNLTLFLISGSLGL